MAKNLLTHVGDALVIGGLLGKCLLRVLTKASLSTLRNHHAEVLAHVKLIVGSLTAKVLSSDTATA